MCSIYCHVGLRLSLAGLRLRLLEQFPTESISACDCLMAVMEGGCCWPRSGKEYHAMSPCLVLTHEANHRSFGMLLVNLYSRP